MNPKVERSLWGIEKANHLVRTLTNSGAKLHLRMEMHIKIATDHSKAALACYSDDIGHAAQLHISAAHRHMGMANWCMGAALQMLDPGTLSQERSLLEDACNTGLKAVVATKQQSTKKELRDR